MRLIHDFTPTTDGASLFGVDEGHQGLSADAETGLVYNRAVGKSYGPHRYLHVTLGRFTRPDAHPQGRYVDGMNGYEYVRGGPLHLLDALGLQGGPPATAWHFADVGVCLGEKGQLSSVFGMLSAVNQLNQTGLKGNSNGDVQYVEPLLGDPHISLPSQDLAPDGTLDILRNNRGIITTARALHELWHGFYEQNIKVHCPKVYSLLKDNSSKYGRRGLWPMDREIVLEEAIGVTIESVFSNRLSGRPDGPTQRGYRSGWPDEDPLKHDDKRLDNRAWQVAQNILANGCDKCTEPEQLLGKVGT